MKMQVLSAAVLSLIAIAVVANATPPKKVQPKEPEVKVFSGMMVFACKPVPPSDQLCQFRIVHPDELQNKYGIDPKKEIPKISNQKTKISI